MINSLLKLFYKLYPKYTFINLNEVDNMLCDLLNKIKKSRFEPDIVVGMLDGGHYPAKKIASSLNKKIVFLKVKHYSIKLFGLEVEYFPLIKRLLYLFGYKEKIRLISKPNIDLNSKKVLVIDDECATGESIKIVTKYLKEKNAKIIKTAVLINYKENKNIDYWVKSSPKKLCMMPWVKISPYYEKNKFV